jgi:hypothetical protein
MKKISINVALIVLSFLLLFCKSSSTKQPLSGKIILEMQLKSDDNLLNDEIKYSPVRDLQSYPKWVSTKARYVNKKARWVIYSDIPLQVVADFGRYRMVCPGDSICIQNTGGKLSYSGKGSKKLSLCDEIVNQEKKLQKPTRNSFTINSIEDFMLWGKYVDDKLALQLSIIENNKSNIQSNEYGYLKTGIVNDCELDRVRSFDAFKDFVRQNKAANMSMPDLNKIWDSIQNKPTNKWLQSLSSYDGEMYTLFALNRNVVQRRFGFNFQNDSLKNKELRTYLYYNSAKQNYKGLLRERLMVYILDEPTITEMGLSFPMTQKLLKDYYTQPGFPEYKQWVKSLEEKEKIRLAKK